MLRLFRPINQLISTISSDTKESIARDIRSRFKASLKDRIAASHAKDLRTPTTSLIFEGWDDFKQSLNSCLDTAFITRLNACEHRQRMMILSAINDKLLELAGANSRMDVARRYQRGIYHHHHQYHHISLCYTLPAIYSDQLSQSFNQIIESPHHTLRLD